MLIYNTSTTSKRSLWPPEAAHHWVVGAWDSVLKLATRDDPLTGKDYDDWASALGANTLGYDAYIKDYNEGNFQPAASLPWDIESRLAAEFCQAMGTEAVRFFKSGSDAVSCAVRLARGFTKRRKVLAFEQCYHGTGDWHGPNLWSKGGIVDSNNLLMRQFGSWLEGFWGDIAAIVVEPVPKAILLPPDGWLQHLREVCDAHGILLISDEIILGYRHSLRGYLRSAGIVPDLACYGKAMAQGAALSACTGRYDVMKLLVDEVHFSGTNNAEPLPLQVAQWTLMEYNQKNICKVLNERGAILKSMLNKAGFETKGLNSRFEVVVDPKKKMDMVRYCFNRGVLWPGFASMTISHSDEQMQRLVEVLSLWKKENSA